MKNYLGWILLSHPGFPHPQLFTGFSGSMQTLDLHLTPIRRRSLDRSQHHPAEHIRVLWANKRVPFFLFGGDVLKNV